MMRSPILLALACTLVAGCVSTVSVEKVGPANAHAPGIRYYLPQVFLVLTPAKDGSMTVETRYLPDPAHEYAITTTSFLGNYAIDVSRTEEGFLETVTFTSNSAELAKQLIASKAMVRTAEIEANAEKAKAAAESAKAAADKEATAAAAGRKAIADAEADLRVATARLDALRTFAGKAGAPPDLSGQVMAAEVARAEHAARLELAREQMAAAAPESNVAASTATVINPAAGNAPSAGAAKPGAKAGEAGPTVPGPLFLRVIMHKDTVELSPVFEEKRYAVWNLPAAQSAPPDLEIYPGKLTVRPERNSGALRFLVRANRQVSEVELSRAKDLGSGQVLDWSLGKQPVADVQPDRTSILVDLSKNLKAGDYELDYLINVGTRDKPEKQTRTITVRVER